MSTIADPIQEISLRETAPPMVDAARRHLEREELPGVGDFWDLLRIFFKALDIPQKNYFKSIFGPPRGLLWDRRRLSELDILDLWRLGRALSFFVDVSLPSITGRPEDWQRRLLPTQARELLWHATEFFHQDDPFGNPSSFPRERWMFINGVATNREMARLNAELLSKLFWRPLTVIHNATNSLGLDLWECAVGKALRSDPDLDDHSTFTEAGLQATIAVLAALVEPNVDKVVLIAHSQGTIIAANVLRAIDKALRVQRGATGRNSRDVSLEVAGSLLTKQDADERPHVRGELATVLRRFLHERDELTVTGKKRSMDAGGRLRKLEVYTFANCANWMRWPKMAGVAPHLEHFANRHDLVARLGVLSPYRGAEEGLVDIDGPIYVSRDAWGHFLNAHHLLPMGDYLRERRTNPEAVNPYLSLDEEIAPRLYQYYEGASAEEPWVVAADSKYEPAVH